MDRMTKLIVAITGLFLCGSIAFLLVDEISSIIEESEAVATITAGEIIDKKMKTERGWMLLGETHPVYYIIIGGTAEYGGEVHEVNRDFCVSENTYNQYIVGDWFDSKDLSPSTANPDLIS